MHRYLLLLSLLLTSFAPAPEPSHVSMHFNLLSKKKEKVGDIKATKTIEGNTVVYEAETHMIIKVVLKQDLYYHIKAVYKDGNLVSCSAYSLLNKKPHSTCQAQWINNRYEIKKDSITSSIGKLIAYSGAMLYFQEPPASGNFFSEINGYESSIRRTADHQFVMTDSRTRKQNSYSYKNGSLESAYINNALFDIIVQRAN